MHYITRCAFECVGAATIIGKPYLLKAGEGVLRLVREGM
ncbi:hypothetical protein KKH3_14990 [Pectobacterium actinidiae]|nr:hypothetical protein KKH3_14990 [Pectobacterium actinidiae]